MHYWALALLAMMFSTQSFSQEVQYADDVAQTMQTDACAKNVVAAVVKQIKDEYWDAGLEDPEEIKIVQLELLKQDSDGTVYKIVPDNSYTFYQVNTLGEAKSCKVLYVMPQSKKSLDP